MDEKKLMEWIDTLSLEEVKKKIKEQKFEEEEPFAFISYSHKDGAIIYPKVLSWMMMGCNLYIDTDFENHASDSNWFNMMREKVEDTNCRMAVCFKSKNYIYSYPALIELLTMRSKGTKRERDAAIDPVLPMNIIVLDRSDDQQFESAEEKKEYGGYFKTLKGRMGQEFCGNNRGEKDCLREGLESWISELDKNKYPEITTDNDADTLITSLEKLYKKGYTNFYPRIGKIMLDWFKTQDLNGNVKDIESDGIVAQFKDQGILVESRKKGPEAIKAVKKKESEVTKEVEPKESEVIKEVEQKEPEVTKEVEQKKPAAKEASSMSGIVVSPSTTLKEFRSYFLDTEFCMKMRDLRLDKSKFPGQRAMFDYVMASALEGCDKKVEPNDYRFKYCALIVAKEPDEKAPKLGASQFTWSSNCGKALNIKTSGKLGPNSELFDRIPETTTLGQLEDEFRMERKNEFKIKNNQAAVHVFEVLYEEFK